MESALLAVSADASTDAWAVGSVDTSTGVKTMHWGGTSWSTVAAPSPGASYNTLDGVDALSATDAWAVGGYSPFPKTQRTLMLHWNGTNWSEVQRPSTPQDALVVASACRCKSARTKTQ